MKPANIERLHERLADIEREIKRKRAKRRKARRNNDKARVSVLTDRIEALKDAEDSVEGELRSARREAGRAWDQVFVDTAKALINEADASAYLREEFEDQADRIIEGRPASEVIDIALARVSRKAHTLIDFSPIPIVGPFIEAHDDKLFAWLAPIVLRPLAERLLDGWLSTHPALRFPTAAPVSPSDSP